MNLLGQLIFGAVLFLALPLGFSWLFKFIYGFFKPLDEVIREDRLHEFELAGFGAGLITGVVIAWWVDNQSLLQ